MTSGRILLATAMIDESVDVGDYFLKVCVPVFQLIFMVFFEIMRVVANTDEAFIQSIPPNITGVRLIGI